MARFVPRSGRTFTGARVHTSSNDSGSDGADPSGDDTALYILAAVLFVTLLAVIIVPLLRKSDRADEDDGEEAADRPARRPGRKRKLAGAVSAPLDGLCPGVSSWVLWLVCGLWLGFTATVCAIFQPGAPELARFLAIVLGLLVVPLGWELWMRLTGARNTDPRYPDGRPLPLAMMRVVPDAELAGRKPIAPDDDPRRFDGAPVEKPPEEEFWDRYNRRLEFPLAAVAVVLLHVLVFVGLVFGLLSLLAPEANPNPKLELVSVSGLDDAGAGSPGSGGKPDQDIIKDVSPEMRTRDILPPNVSIEQAKENIKNIVLEDPSGRLPVAASNAAAYESLDESLRKKLLGVGSQKGNGPGAGKGDTGQQGAGPGGTGADSTRARGLRWVLRFKVANGRDYLDQLRSMGAEILVPLPPGEKECLLFPDLQKTDVNRTATDADFRRLAGKIKFSDTRRDAVQGVAGALGLDITPKTFWAFFPKELEDHLARLETGYRNRRAEDIEETVFRVTVRGGTYEFVVDEQVGKR